MAATLVYETEAYALPAASVGSPAIVTLPLVRKNGTRPLPAKGQRATWRLRNASNTADYTHTSGKLRVFSSRANARFFVDTSASSGGSPVATPTYARKRYVELSGASASTRFTKTRVGAAESPVPADSDAEPETGGSDPDAAATCSPSSVDAGENKQPSSQDPQPPSRPPADPGASEPPPGAEVPPPGPTPFREQSDTGPAPPSPSAPADPMPLASEALKAARDISQSMTNGREIGRPSIGLAGGALVYDGTTHSLSPDMLEINLSLGVAANPRGSVGSLAYHSNLGSGFKEPYDALAYRLSRSSPDLKLFVANVLTPCNENTIMGDQFWLLAPEGLTIIDQITSTELSFYHYPLEIVSVDGSGNPSLLSTNVNKWTRKMNIKNATAGSGNYAGGKHYTVTLTSQWQNHGLFERVEDYYVSNPAHSGPRYTMKVAKLTGDQTTRTDEWINTQTGSTRSITHTTVLNRSSGMSTHGNITATHETLQFKYMGWGEALTLHRVHLGGTAVLDTEYVWWGENETVAASDPNYASVKLRKSYTTAWAAFWTTQQLDGQSNVVTERHVVTPWSTLTAAPASNASVSALDTLGNTNERAKTAVSYQYSGSDINGTVLTSSTLIDGKMSKKFETATNDGSRTSLMKNYFDAGASDFFATHIEFAPNDILEWRPIVVVHLKKGATSDPGNIHDVVSRTEYKYYTVFYDPNEPLGYDPSTVSSTLSAALPVEVISTTMTTTGEMYPMTTWVATHLASGRQLSTRALIKNGITQEVLREERWHHDGLWRVTEHRIDPDGTHDGVLNQKWEYQTPDMTGLSGFHRTAIRDRNDKGIVTTRETDGFGRPLRDLISGYEGAGLVPADNNIRVSYTYSTASVGSTVHYRTTATLDGIDAAGTILTGIAPSGSSTQWSRASTLAVDLAGRTARTESVTGRVYDHTYSVDAPTGNYLKQISLASVLLKRDSYGRHGRLLRMESLIQTNPSVPVPGSLFSYTGQTKTQRYADRMPADWQLQRKEALSTLIVPGDAPTANAAVTTRQYDGLGRVTYRWHPSSLNNDATGTPMQFTETYGYDDFGRPSSRTLPSSGGGNPSVRLAYTSDATGQYTTSGLATSSGTTPVASIRHTTTKRVKDASDQWWDVVIERLGSSSATPAKTTKTCLGPFPNDRVANRVTTLTRIESDGLAWETELRREPEAKKTTFFDRRGAVGGSLNTRSYESYAGLMRIVYDPSATTLLTYSPLRERIQLVSAASLGSPPTLTYYPGTGRVYRESKGGTVVNTSYYYTGNTFYSGLVSQIDTPTPAGTGSAYRAYDSVGTLIFEWGNGTQPVKYTYDTFLRMASMTTYHTSSLSDFGAATWPSSGGQITTWNYGTAGELALQREKVYPDSQKTRYTYHPSGKLATRLWSRGGGITTTYGYDGYGRLTSIDYPSHPSSPDNGASYDVTYAYNPAGQISERYDAAGKTTITYRPDGRVDDETTATSSGTQNLLVGAQVSRTFDALGQLEKLDSQVTSSAVSPTIKYAYENVNFGRLGEIEVSTIGSTTTYDRRLRYFYGTDTRYWTTLYGDVKSGGSYANTSRGERNFSSERLSYAYWYGVNGGSSALIQRFNLDYTGDLVTGVRREDGKWLYGYDTAGQVTAARKEFVNGSGVPTGESYGGTKAGYAYDLMGNRTSSSEYGGGVSDAATPVTRIYTPNVLNQYSPITNDQTVSVTGFRPNSSTAVTINTVAPTYQSGGNGLYWWRNFTHTPGTTYENIIIKENGATVAVGSQYVPPSSESLAYDTDGNLTSDGRWAYTWDAENRLRMMTSHTSGSANRWRLTFSYDGLSRRIEKKTELQYSGAGGWFLTSWERYVYDGWNQILTVHMEDNGTTVRGRVSTNVWGPDLASLPYDRQTWQAAGGVAGLVLIRDGVTTFTGHAGWSAPTDPTDDDYFLFHDRLGNVTGYRKAVVGVAVGAMAAIYEYDAFGRELRASYDAVGSPNVKNMPYRFSTKFTDVESGFNYFGYRIYEPTKGRWLNRDPIGERGGSNLYSMVGNDAVNQIDVLGHGKICVAPNCKDIDLSGYMYLAEAEPPAPGSAAEEGPKIPRELPSPDKCVEADAIYYPGGATKIGNTGTMVVQCPCGKPENKWSPGWFPSKGNGAYWPSGEQGPGGKSPQESRWPNLPGGPFPPYPDAPGVTLQPPLDPFDWDIPPPGGYVGGP